MDLKFPVLIAVLALLYALTFLPPGSDEGPYLSLELNGDYIAEGSEARVSAAAGGEAFESITVELGGEEKKFECKGIDPCVFDAVFSPKKGVYSVGAKATALSGKSIEKTAKLTVVQAVKKCIDGTPFSGCSAEQPLYCNEGSLEGNCAECGCPPESGCSGGKCIAIAPKISLQAKNFPALVPAGKEFSAEVVLSSPKEFPEGAEYEIALAIGDFFYSKTISAPAGEKEFSVAVENIVLKEGKHDINAVAYSFALEKGIAGEFFSGNAIEALSEMPELAPPSITSLYAEGDDIIISWSPVAGAKDYVLYKSVGANAAFISYSEYSVFPAGKETAVLQAMNTGAHFFVVTARDFFGDESGYSEVAGITVGQ